MFVATVYFRSQPHKRGEILSAVDETIERMRRTAGCARTRLLVDSEDSNAFMLVSDWHSNPDTSEFFESRDFQIFRGIRTLLRDEPMLVLDHVQERVTRAIRAR